MVMEMMMVGVVVVFVVAVTSCSRLVEDKYEERQQCEERHE
jgi:hypothetical protein